MEKRNHLGVLIAVIDGKIEQTKIDLKRKASKLALSYSQKYLVDLENQKAKLVKAETQLHDEITKEVYGY